jgi:L-fuculose-phosphate aldolase
MHPPSMKSIHQPREVLLEQGRRNLSAHFSSIQYSLRSRVALTCRILYDNGHASGLAGQITARNDDGTYLTQALGYGFDEITCSNLLQVDKDLNVISGAGMPNPANRFHSWIYSLRPDVRCIVHTHPLNVCALPMVGAKLEVSQMDSCMLYNDVAFLDEWPGVPVGNEEGALISGCLGSKRAAILAHHGLVVAARTVEEACVFAVQVERTAKLQIAASRIGSIRALNPNLAQEAHDWILQPSRSIATFSYFARQVLKSLPKEEIDAILTESKPE